MFYSNPHSFLQVLLIFCYLNLLQYLTSVKLQSLFLIGFSYIKIFCYLAALIVSACVDFFFFICYFLCPKYVYMCISGISLYPWKKSTFSSQILHFHIYLCLCSLRPDCMSFILINSSLWLLREALLLHYEDRAMCKKWPWHIFGDSVLVENRM